MNQSDSEKQAEQAPAEPLKVRTSVKAGQFGENATYRGGSDPFTMNSESGTSGIGVSGHGLEMFDPIFVP